MKRRQFVKSISLGGMAASLLPGSLFAGVNDSFLFQSPFLKAALCQDYPAFNFLSVDSLGGNKTTKSPLFNLAENTNIFSGYVSKGNGQLISYWTKQNKKSHHPSWQVHFKGRGFSLTSHADEHNHSFEIKINQEANHATVLGICNEPNRIQLPCLIHFPGMGTLRVTSSHHSASLTVEARRFFTEVNNANNKPSVTISFPAATSQQKIIAYKLEVVKIHPDSSHLKNKTLREAFERNFLNIFQVHPKLRTLANNSSSDTVACTLYMSAAVAQLTPPLAEGLTANDLVRMSLDRYISGMKAYTMLGYTDNYEGADTVSWKSKYDSLDAYPSLLLAAGFYLQSTGNANWLKKNLESLKAWAAIIIKNDIDGDGLIEFPLSGNYNSWQGTANQRPANWWDTIGFGHKDALSNIIAFKSLHLFGSLLTENGYTEGSTYSAFAERIKLAFYLTFYNPATSVLAGWKSVDGELHDYYFTFITSMAITYGLVDDDKGNAMMNALLEKMNVVGYTNFSLGLPGNLIPIKKGDYTHLEHRWGGPSKDDGTDAFQIYENGGATACYTYFFVEALKKLNRKEDAEIVLHPILKSIGEEKFSGKCENGMSNDWKTWKGECWGYEGFLCDGYMVLLAAAK